MKKIDLTKGKVINVLTVLALPIMATSLLQFTYNLIDMLWVGALGSDAVASVGSSSFFVGLGYAINSIVVIGTTIKLAQSIGRKEPEKEKEYINAGLVINLIIAFIIQNSTDIVLEYRLGFSIFIIMNIITVIASDIGIKNDTTKEDINYCS